MRAYRHGKKEEKRVRNVLIVIWEVSTASRMYAQMEGDDDDASGVTTSSKVLVIAGR